MNKLHCRFHIISFLLLLLLLPFSTAHADVTITTTETATVDLETRNTGASRNATVSPTGAVDVTANPATYNSALWASVDGWNVTVSSGGQIKGNTFGVLFNSDPDCCGLSRSGSLFNAGAISAASATGDTAGVNIGGERAVINNSGTITSVATSTAAIADGVNMTGDTSTLTNSGTIAASVTAEDASAYGAYLMGLTNTLTNAGTITASATSSNTVVFGAITGGDINIITNTGTITASVTSEYSGAYGVVVAGVTNDINNSGTITATASAADSGAIAVSIAGGTNSLTNAGTIASVATAENDESTAVFMNGDTNTITNSGAITANAAYEGRGVLLGGAYNTLTNTGTISGSGSGENAWGFGVHIDSGTFNTVTNHGTITASAPGSDSNMAIGVYFEDSLNTNALTNTGVITAAAIGAAASIASGAWLTGDENTLTNSGTITATSDGFANGARFIGNVNTAINSGTITASTPAAGSGAYGIIMNGGANTATNSGTIAAAGPSAGSGTYGITMVGDTNTLTNSGTINASSDGAANGVRFIGNVNTAINSGTITASTPAAGSGAYGIFMMGDSNTVTNSGAITVTGSQTGSSAAGVAMVGITNTLANSGIITATPSAAGSLGYGAAVSGVTNTITNSGTISGNTGIFITGGNTTIDNSGTISGAGGTAIALANSTNTVTLRTGSVINGIINGSAGAADSMELNGAGSLGASQIVGFENLKKTGAGLWAVTAGMAPLAISNTISLEAGTLAFKGNAATASYTQNTGSTLGFVVTPAASPAVTASGTATLNNGNVLIMPEAGFYARNTNYGVVFSAATLAGAFGSVSSTSPFLAPVLTAGVNNYSLSLARDYALPAATENQRAVAAALNGYADTWAGSASGSELGSLMLLSNGTQAQVALDQLSGYTHANFAGINFSSFNQYLGTLTGRMGGFATGGPSFAHTGRILLASRSDTVSDAGNALLTLNAMRDENESTTWGFWFRGYGNLGETKGDDRSAKYGYNTGGLTAGFDRKISESLLVGLSAGYSRTQIDLKQLAENATVASYQGSLYAAFLARPWYVNGILAYGYNRNATSRNIAFGGITRTAVADYPGHTLAAYGEAGYRMMFKTVSVIPMAAFQASMLSRDGFTESDAGAFNLTVDKERTASYLSALGIKTRKDFTVSAVTLTPEARINWLHEFSNDDYMINAAFTGAPAATFSIRGEKPNRDSFALGLSLTCLVQENVNLFVAYDANLASDRFEQGGSLGLRVRW